MTIHEAQQQLTFKLHDIYEDREASAITNLVLENVTGWKKIDRVVNKQSALSLLQEELLKKYTEELLMHKPVQYVLHEAWFAGMKFYVDENVLIPRPETEELVDWILEEAGGRVAEETFTFHHSPFTILDIGTGSGCIPIALKKKLPDAKIFSCDVSEAALQIANQNAKDNNVEINFINLDFLNTQEREKLPTCDIIVSNPPYVPMKDEETMQQNVIGYEPHLALFVEDNNPLIFYEAIADFASKKLLPEGKIFVEIHEAQSSNVKKLFLLNNFQHVEIKKDILGKERMIKATTLL